MNARARRNRILLVGGTLLLLAILTAAHVQFRRTMVEPYRGSYLPKGFDLKGALSQIEIGDHKERVEEVLGKPAFEYTSISSYVLPPIPGRFITTRLYCYLSKDGVAIEFIDDEVICIVRVGDNPYDPEYFRR